MSALKDDTPQFELVEDARTDEAKKSDAAEAAKKKKKAADEKDREED